jgi:hypothetical protein
LRRDPFTYLLIGIPVRLEAYKVVNPIVMLDQAGRRLAHLQVNRLDDVVHGTAFRAAPVTAGPPVTCPDAACAIVDRCRY